MPKTVPKAQAKRTRTIAAPDSILADGVGRDVLEARAEMLLRSVARQSNVTPEMLAAYRPGGADNPDQSAMGWLMYLCQLHRWHATGPAQPEAHASARWDARAMQDMRAAMAAEPIHVVLESGRAVAVFPKGDYALNRLTVGQVALAWCVERKLALLDIETTPAVIEALRCATELESQLNAEFVAILVHPDAGVPWTDDTTWEHPLPLWTKHEITSFDLLAIRRAHLECNVHRINAIAERTHVTASGADAMPLAAFLGVMAAELQVPPQEFARKWSLGEIFATSLAKTDASERAKQRAEAESASRG